MSNPNFNPTYSTLDIWRSDEQAQCLDDGLATMEADIAALETTVANKADIIHTHGTYAAFGHNHDADYADIDHTHTASEVGAAPSEHTHSNYATQTYVDTRVASLVDSAPETLNTLDELAAALNDDPNFATSIATQIGTRASATDLTSHTGNKSNPHGVTLSQLGLTATAAELNKMDGVTATTAELNYVDGVTSNIQTQLNGKAASSHTHSGYAASSHTHNASNITAGILPVTYGGTGSSSATVAVTLTRGTNTGTDSSAYGYDCKYIPYLKMCFVRVYAQPKSSWSADTDYEVATISNSNYYPANMIALTAYAQKEISAYVNTEGQIIVRPYENVSGDYGARLAGFWFVE